MTTNSLNDIYDRFLAFYGPQGWWPITSLASKTVKGSSSNEHGYHPADFSFPRTPQQKFEIAVGAILTQNTAWKNVRLALHNLKRKNLLVPGSFISTRKGILAKLLRPSGYFNMKALKLKHLDSAWMGNKWAQNRKIPSRKALLSVWGIGPETADAILLYAFHEPSFVVDAYTKRIFSRVGLFDKDAAYEEVRDFFHENLERGEGLFNEYHALIVRHAKSHCKKLPICQGCPIADLCEKRGVSKTGN